MIVIEDDDMRVNHAIESRDHGGMRMRFSRDPDTTRRLEKLRRLDPKSEIPWWRRLLRKLFRI